MSKLLPLVMIGGAAFWAHQTGHLAPLLDSAKAALGIATDEPAAGQGDPKPTPAAAVKPLPAKTAISPYEALLIEHDLYVSNWAAKNREWVAAMMRTENAAMNPAAHGSAGEWGLLQVMPATARDLNEWGYNQVTAIDANMKTEAGSIYFGTAYLDWLANKYPTKGRDWITRAYNGGPGWAGSDKGRTMTAAYLAKVKKNLRRNREDFSKERAA